MNYLVVLFVSLLSVSCAGSCNPASKKAEVVKEIIRPQVSYQTIGRVCDDQIIIDRNVDLKGGECKLPNSMTLVFKGGIVKNGTIVGNNTKIDSKGVAFDHVLIDGYWNVPVISTDLFVDLGYNNALIELFALLNPNMHNKITIKEGNYPINARGEWSRILRVGSNTDLIINGTITLQPNSYKGCDIIFVEGHDITITGKGIIKGDKHTHTGDKGEWGMGINVHNSHNVKIKGLTIRDCWGDCIYVGTNSTSVTIEDCKLMHGRRQGISVTSANRVVIRKCSISGIQGTAPEYAIDIEPNNGDTVDNVLIERVKIRDCIGGIMTYGKAADGRVGRVEISKNDIQSNVKWAIGINTCNTLIVKGNKLRNTSCQKLIRCVNINNVTLNSNTLRHPQLLNISSEEHMNIVDCGNVVRKNNRVKSF